LFVVCLISAALVRVSEINFAPGVGQKLLDLDAPMGVRKFCEKTSSRVTSTKGAGVRLVCSRRADHTCVYERSVIASARRQDLAREDSVA
jgi:hypothetical protein